MEINRKDGDVSVAASNISDRERKYAEVCAEYGGKLGKLAAGGLSAGGAVYKAAESPEAAGLILVGGAVATYVAYRAGDLLGTIGGTGVGMKAGGTTDSVLKHFGIEEELEGELE